MISIYTVLTRNTPKFFISNLSQKFRTRSEYCEFKLNDFHKDHSPAEIIYDSTSVRALVRGKIFYGKKPRFYILNFETISSLVSRQHILFLIMQNFGPFSVQKILKMFKEKFIITIFKIYLKYVYLMQ